MHTPEQEKILKRFRKLIKDAAKANVMVVVDAEEIAIRLIPQEDMPTEGDMDLRSLGETLFVDNACGGAVSVCQDLGTLYAGRK